MFLYELEGVLVGNIRVCREGEQKGYFGKLRYCPTDLKQRHIKKIQTGVERYCEVVVYEHV